MKTKEKKPTTMSKLMMLIYYVGTWSIIQIIYNLPSSFIIQNSNLRTQFSVH